MSPSPPGRKG
ncbi:129ef044-1b48-4be5-86d4-9a82ad40fdfe [Thermothielavioides terrestris]|uniref:129ef044-1b48-4be5-86d4-9a82ad40fdfe n=1 Tax=Thermothielavioides terrestris TaxID=2587410 RepID=A0A3S4D9U0_9PEZI|nr:129ef044-1b48-4be5-86d4-9a82ad40fdfe [Thermothielavioides terrestris]